MCGRYALAKPEQIYEEFEIQQRMDTPAANTNIKPGQYAPVIARNGETVLRLMRWGFVPPWAKDEKLGYKMINARAETIAEKPSFKPALGKHRCLIPSTGFYEWQATEKGKKPFLFTPNHGDLFLFAGLYSLWKNPAGEHIPTYTIITTEANNLVGQVHDRMPAILDREQAEIWLDPAVNDPMLLTGMLGSYQSERMDMQPILGKL